MNGRVVLFGTLAAGLLGLGGYMLSGAGASQSEPAPLVEAPRETAVVTTKAALAPGHVLRAVDLATLPWPEGRLPAAAITIGSAAAGELVGSVTARAFVAGELVVAGSVIKPGERGFLAAIVAPGKRAVAVSVDAASAAGGLIWPGDRVDVILTQEISVDGVQPSQKVVSETILTDARVLSSDQRLGTASAQPVAEGEGGAAAPPRVATTVTLEVSQMDAERVSVGATLGKLSLALRAVRSGPVTVATGPTWAGGVSPALATVRARAPAPPAMAAAPASVAAPAAPAAPRGVRILRGSEKGV